MSYQQNGKIEAADINTTLAGSASASAASTTLNAIWGAGSGDRGYGQTPYVPNVVQNNKVTAGSFAPIVTTTATAANHQNTALVTSPVPIQDQLIEYASGVLLTNINTVNTNRLNAKLQGSTATTVGVNNVVWNDTLTFTFKVAFPSPNEARYFFNCGGQLALTFFHPTGSTGTGSTGAVNTLFNQLCTACGTIIMSAMSNGNATILTTSYKGVTKVGGTGTPMVLAENKGYYGLTTAYQSIFKQKASSVVPGYYSDSFLEVSARTNGTIGSSGDNGDTVYLQVQLDQVPNSAAVRAGTTVNLVVIPPAQAGVVPGAFLPVRSWAMPTVTYTSAATGAPIVATPPVVTPPPPVAPPPPVTPPPVTPPPTPTVPTYVFTNPPAPTTQVEGTTRSFTVGTTNVPNGTILYWSANGAFFSSGSQPFARGAVTINNNNGSFNVTLPNDGIPNTTGSYYVRLHSNNGYGAASMLQDSPTITLVEAPPSIEYRINGTDFVNEGSSIAFSIAQLSGSPTTIPWTITGVTLNDISSVQVSNPAVPGGYINVTPVSLSGQLTFPSFYNPGTSSLTAAIVIAIARDGIVENSSEILTLTVGPPGNTASDTVIISANNT